MRLELQSPKVWRTFLIPCSSLCRYRFQTPDCFSDFSILQQCRNSSEVQPEKLAVRRPSQRSLKLDHSECIPYSQPQDLHLECMKGNIPFEEETVPSITWKVAHIGAELPKIKRVGLSDQIHCLIAGGAHPYMVFCIARIPSFALICTWIMDY